MLQARRDGAIELADIKRAAPGEVDQPRLEVVGREVDERANRALLTDDARELWDSVSALPRLLFAEPSPAPAKYWLARMGLIDSAEVRLPMVEVSRELAVRLDAEIARRQVPVSRLEPSS